MLGLLFSCLLWAPTASLIGMTPMPAACPSDPDRDAVRPVTPPATVVRPASESVEWINLGRDSVRFLTLMHAFRWATEPGTRSGGVGLGHGYLRSVGNLHGWADGDPFYVNYVGHPMQGAVSGRLFQLHDPRYRSAEFGRDRTYWKGKLRAAAFAWGFSEQFEIGPLSEASIGHIQRDFPQQGFVDHVITPSFGLAWTIGEDALDRYVVRSLEDRSTNRWLRIALRTGLNPTRSFANLMDGRAPWHRDSRDGILTYRGAPALSTPAQKPAHVMDTRPAPFEFSAAAGYRRFSGTHCMGGGAEGAYRVADSVQLVLAVNGCKLLGLPSERSGDILAYQVGPRWTPRAADRWSPYAHLLVGGMKVTEEQLYPARKAVIETANANLDPSLAYTLHDQYTTHSEANAVAFTAGTGLDYKVDDALAIRVASVEYVRTGLHAVNGTPFAGGFQVTSGLVLRFGTW